MGDGGWSGGGDGPKLPGVSPPGRLMWCHLVANCPEGPIPSWWLVAAGLQPRLEVASGVLAAGRAG